MDAGETVDGAPPSKDGSGGGSGSGVGCGGQGQPCCNGTACNNGLTCSAAVCQNATSSSGGASDSGSDADATVPSCPRPPTVVAGASCDLPPELQCTAAPVPACGGTSVPTCTCQSGAWQCVTSFPPCDAGDGPCPPPSEINVDGSCNISPYDSCSATPVPACGGATTTSPACTCQSYHWQCVTSYPVCDGG